MANFALDEAFESSLNGIAIEHLKLILSLFKGPVLHASHAELSTRVLELYREKVAAFQRGEIEKYYLQSMFSIVQPELYSKSDHQHTQPPTDHNNNHVASENAKESGELSASDEDTMSFEGEANERTEKRGELSEEMVLSGGTPEHVSAEDEPDTYEKAIAARDCSERESEHQLSFDDSDYWHSPAYSPSSAPIETRMSLSPERSNAVSGTNAMRSPPHSPARLEPSPSLQEMEQDAMLRKRALESSHPSSDTVPVHQGECSRLNKRFCAHEYDPMHPTESGENALNHHIADDRTSPTLLPRLGINKSNNTSNNNNNNNNSNNSRQPPPRFPNSNNSTNSTLVPAPLANNRNYTSFPSAPLANNNSTQLFAKNRNSSKKKDSTILLPPKLTGSNNTHQPTKNTNSSNSSNNSKNNPAQPPPPLACHNSTQPPPLKPHTDSLPPPPWNPLGVPLLPSLNRQPIEVQQQQQILRLQQEATHLKQHERQHPAPHKPKPKPMVKKTNDVALMQELLLQRNALVQCQAKVIELLEKQQKQQLDQLVQFQTQQATILRLMEKQDQQQQLQCQLLALILNVREGKFEQPPLPQQTHTLPTTQFSQAQFVQSSSVPCEVNGLAGNGQEVNWDEILKIIEMYGGQNSASAPVSSSSNGGFSRQQFDYEL